MSRRAVILVLIEGLFLVNLITGNSRFGCQALLADLV